MTDLSHTFPSGRTVTLRDKTVTVGPEPVSMHICESRDAAEDEFWRLCKALSRQKDNDRIPHWIRDEGGVFYCVYSGETQTTIGLHKGNLEVCLSTGDDVFIPPAIVLAVLGTIDGGGVLTNRP